VQGDFLIHDWLVQPQINTVEKAGRRWHLEPKVMQVLVYLAQHPGEVLSKERLIEAIWRDTFVGDDVLVRCISEIRYVFGDDVRSPSVIQTIPKAGYRLIAPVTMETDITTELGLSVLRRSPALQQAPDPSAEAEAMIDVAEPPAPSDTDREPFTTESNAKSLASALPTGAAPRQQEALTETAGRGIWLVPIAAVVSLLLLAVLIYWGSVYPSPLRVFWAPVLKAPESALFCVADQNHYSFITLRDAADPSKQVTLKDNLSAVVIDDVDAIIRVAGVLRTYGKQYQLKAESSTTLSDLRNGPAIIVGAFDNAWALRFTRPLRYHFDNNADMTQFRIVDSNNPAHPGWVVDRNQQMATNNYKDYAIAARFTDVNTGKPAIVIAGVGRGGTIAAGEFLTNPEELAKLLRDLRSSGNKENLEIVLSTQIIDGQPATPKIEATYFW
jgi:DNA-binding winged helix-turn-helix (wHTH) protein